tara:strand:- start:5969 stop:6358 length:390 start_codon:yes stop_codon:yes gene_type:complete
MLDFQKKKQLSIMVKIAMVDEDFADEEKAVIKKISKRYGATDQEIEDIFNSPPTTESLTPMTVNDKMDFMMDCILVILADQVVTSSEDYFAKHIATSLGFKTEVVPYLIEHKDASREEMKESMIPFLVR